jgi:hypothetical protein
MLRARSTSGPTIWSWIERCTSRREPAMQVWPVAAKMPAKAPTTALSRSASSNTMLGDLPPSSSVTGTSLRPASDAIWRPTPVLPVKLTRSMRPLVRSASPARWSPVTTLKTPGGNPASRTKFANSSVVTDACSDGLTTTQLPAASAGASLFESKPIGEFQAVMSTATPMGSRRVKSKTSRWSSGIVSPKILSA